MVVSDRAIAEHCISSATQRVDWNADPCDVVRNQILAGELPLALSYLFPEVRALHELRDEARSVLTEAITELTDGQGLPHARLLPVLGPLLACWTRSRLLGKRLKGGAWSAKAERQYEWMVRHTIRLAADNHQFALATSRTSETASSTDSASIWCEPLFETALGLAGDRGDFCAAVRALPAQIVHKPKRFKKAKPPKPSLNSDWAGITVMSDGWSPTDARLAAKYLDRDVTIELAAGGVPLFAGQWSFQAHCDGQPVHPTADWEQSCWESGKKYDFLELSIQLSSGLRLERQIVFGRVDRVLYLAEMLIADDSAPRRLQFSSQLPLAHGATLECRKRNARRHDHLGRKCALPSCRSACANGAPIRAAVQSIPKTANSRSRKKRAAEPSAARSSSISTASAPPKNALGDSSPSARTWKSFRPMSPSAIAPNPATTNGSSTARSAPLATARSSATTVPASSAPAASAPTANLKSGSKSKLSDATINLTS